MRAMAQPCLCLWRGLLQMTMVRPCRLMTRQRSHMGLTDGRTFMRGKARAQAFACRRGPSSYQNPPFGQDSRAVRRDGDRVLEMGRQRTIRGRDRPVVV